MNSLPRCSPRAHSETCVLRVITTNVWRGTVYKTCLSETLVLVSSLNMINCHNGKKTQD
jgi:hypothetical protein